VGGLGLATIGTEAFSEAAALADGAGRIAGGGATAMLAEGIGGMVGETTRANVGAAAIALSVGAAGTGNAGAAEPLTVRCPGCSEPPRAALICG